MTEILTAEQLALLRAAQHGTPVGHLLFWPLQEVAHATIDQVAFTYPLTQLTVTSTSAAWTSIKTGQMIRITDGSGNLIATNCVRKTPTSDTLYIGAIGRGDPGRAQQIGNDLVNGYTVTVYDWQPLYSFYSRIANGVFYKFFDTPYTDQGSNPVPRVNLGQWRHAFSNAAGQAQFTFVATVLPWAGKSVTGYQWAVDGDTGFVPDAGSMTGSTITITLDEGLHRIECTGTDSGGKSKTALRPAWVTPRTGLGAPLNTLRAVDVGSDRQTLQGRTAHYDIYGAHDLTEDVIFDGAPCLWVEYATHGGQTLDDGVIVDHYVGMMSDPNRSGSLNRTVINLDTLGVMPYLNKVGNAPQAIVESNSPADWTQILTGLGTPSFAAWYVLEYHCPNATALFDFNEIPDGSPVRKHSYGLSSKSIGAQVNDCAAFVMDGNFGSASDGSIECKRNPNRENTAFRDAMETRFTMNAGDTVGDITVPMTYASPSGGYLLGAFIVGESDDAIDAYEAIAPDISAAQGPDKGGGQTIAVRSVDELLQKVGDGFAAANTTTPEYTQQMNRNFDVIDPAKHFNTWIERDIPARFDPRGVGYTGRVLVTVVDRRWERKNENAPALKTVTWTFAPETQGQPGVLLPKTSLDAQPTQTVINVNPLYANLALACTDQGDLGRTLTFLDPSPQWVSIKGNITGSVVDWDFDYHSPLIRSGLRYGPLGVLAVSVDGATVKVWYTPSMLSGTPVWTNQATYTMGDSTTTTQVRILANPRTAQNAWVFWRTRTRTFGAKTTDGSSWDGSAAGIGTAYTDSDNDNATLGACFEGDNVLVTAWDGTQYTPFAATATVGTFSAIGSAPSVAGNAPNPIIQRGETDTIYATVYGAITPTTSAYNTDTLDLLEHTFDLAGSDTPIFDPSNPLRYAGIPSGTLPTGSYYDVAYHFKGGVPVSGFYATSIFVSIRGVIRTDAALNLYESTKLNRPDVTITVLDSSAATLYSYSATGYNPDGGLLFSFAPSQQIDSKYFLTLSDAIAVPGETASIEIDVSASWLNKHFISHGGTNAEFTLETQVALYSTFPSVSSTTLYRVTDYIGSPTWTDISPDTNSAPRNRMALASDSYSQRFTTLATDDTALTDLYASNDAGTTPSLIASGINDTGVRRSGNRLIFWGAGTLDYSVNGGATRVSKLGNWASSIGTTGTFLKVGGII